MKRKVFDLDGVLANFVEGFLAWADERGGYEGQPCCWKTADKYQFFPAELFRRIAYDAQFWLGLRRMPGALVSLATHGIVPDLYLTARPIDSSISAAWLKRNLFPQAGVVTVERAQDKLAYLDPGDIFVDDHPNTVRWAQEKGVTALLMDAPFHRGCEQSELEGLTVIRDLKEVADYL